MQIKCNVLDRQYQMYQPEYDEAKRFGYCVLDGMYLEMKLGCLKKNLRNSQAGNTVWD